MKHYSGISEPEGPTQSGQFSADSSGMNEELQTATLGIVAGAIGISAALFVLAPKLIAVAVLGGLLIGAGLALVRQYHQVSMAQSALAAERTLHAQTIRAGQDPSTSSLAAQEAVRGDEAKILEMIAADTDTDEVLSAVTTMLARLNPGASFRIITDDLFSAEHVDHSYEILPRTDTDIGWVLQVNVDNERSLPDPSVLAAAQDLARLALDKHRSRTNLLYQADHDALTGLLSRRAVLAKLDSAIMTGSSVGLIYCDIDEFKEINDTLGHPAGDELLIGISRRLTEAAEAASFDCQVGRLGGDEYLIVASGLARKSMVNFVEQLSFDSRVPFPSIGGTTVVSSLSIGVTFAGPRSPEEPVRVSAELLKEADLGLYQVKRAGRDGFRFFDDELREILDEQRRIKDDLAMSIKNVSGIHAMFQPQFDGEENLLGFEALGRWYRQGVGQVPPSEYIGIASEHGLMADFDFAVFKHTAQVIGGLRREGRDFGTVAINVSAERLECPNFVESTIEVLRRYSIDPRTIVLEITESSLLRDLRERGKRLEQLRVWGVRIAIDDFGTGYSSLSYLRELPVDIVKLDKDFVSDIDSSPESQAIVRAILALADALDLAVIAEGVERPEQHEMLLSLGCTVFQGFLLGRPLELDQARQMAEKRWTPDPFSVAHDWNESAPDDSSSLRAREPQQRAS